MLIEKDLVHEIILASPSGGFNIFDTLSPFLRPLLKKRHAQNKKGYISTITASIVIILAPKIKAALVRLDQK